MKTPVFWSSRSMLSNLLVPAANLFETSSILYRASIKPVSLPVPVICIGNLTAGGAGKTPIALHMGEMLKRKNIPAFFLSRGYGGKLAGPVLVNPQKHTASEVGDEPLLLSAVLPTIVAKDRLAGAQYAIHKGAQMIVMDDGFQNPRIAKALSLVVIDGRNGFGNGRLLPAGPLRESPRMGLARAHAVIIVNRTTRVPVLPPDTLVFNAKTTLVENFSLKGKKIFPFCGIARPENFFDMLTGLGAHIVEKKIFPDHYPYRESDINLLIAKANKEKLPLITTAKDAVRIPANLRECIAVMDMTLEMDNEPMLEAMIDYVLQK